MVSNLICQALSGRPVTIYGDGTQTRSFCYVSDMVQGLIALMESDAVDMEPVNLGNPDERMVNELLSYILGILGTVPKIEYRPLPIDDPRRRRPEIARARELLRWQPRTPLLEGLARTCAWFAEEIGVQREAEDAVTIAAA